MEQDLIHKPIPQPAQRSILVEEECFDGQSACRQGFLQVFDGRKVRVSVAAQGRQRRSCQRIRCINKSDSTESSSVHEGPFAAIVECDGAFPVAGRPVLPIFIQLSLVRLTVVHRLSTVDVPFFRREVLCDGVQRTYESPLTAQAPDIPK